MKIVRLIALALFPLCALAQTAPYTLNGKMSGVTNPVKVYLTYQLGKTLTVDSAVIKKGSFEFNGQVADPFRAKLIIDHQGLGVKALKNPDLLFFYIEKGKISIAGTDSISKAVISGSVVNAENKQHDELIAPVLAKQNALMNEYYTAPADMKNSREFQQGLEDRYNLLNDKLKELDTKFIQSNPNSFISLYALEAIAGGTTPEIEAIEPLFNGLTSQLKNTLSGKELSSQIASMKRLLIGAVAPDFTQPTADGKPIKLSDFKGKYVLLDFWASWCRPCRAENPNVVKMYNQYKDKNFTVLGVSLDNAKAKNSWLAAIEKDQLTWNHVSDLKGWENAAAQLYLVHAIPQNFLINPEGVIVAKNLRGEELEAKLKEIFK